MVLGQKFLSELHAVLTAACLAKHRRCKLSKGSFVKFVAVVVVVGSGLRIREQRTSEVHMAWPRPR